MRALLASFFLKARVATCTVADKLKVRMSHSQCGTSRMEQSWREGHLQTISLRYRNDSSHQSPESPGLCRSLKSHVSKPRHRAPVVRQFVSRTAHHPRRVLSPKWKTLRRSCLSGCRQIQTHQSRSLTPGLSLRQVTSFFKLAERIIIIPTHKMRGIAVAGVNLFTASK